MQSKDTLATKELKKICSYSRRQKAQGRRQKLRKSRVSKIKNVLITLAVAIAILRQDFYEEKANEVFNKNLSEKWI
jgi:hypothetical protein